MITLERITKDGLLLRDNPAFDQNALLAMGESVHRELRPEIPEDYVGFLSGIGFCGVHLTQLIDDNEVKAIALWRVFQTTFAGRRFEIDDLITAGKFRSQGHGSALLSWLESRSKALSCDVMTLNSALHRHDAHRFYAREGFAKFGFHFSRAAQID